MVKTETPDENLTQKETEEDYIGLECGSSKRLRELLAVSSKSATRFEMPTTVKIAVPPSDASKDSHPPGLESCYSHQNDDLPDHMKMVVLGLDVCDSSEDLAYIVGPLQARGLEEATVATETSANFEVDAEFLEETQQLKGSTEEVRQVLEMDKTYWDIATASEWYHDKVNNCLSTQENRDHIHI